MSADLVGLSAAGRTIQRGAASTAGLPVVTPGLKPSQAPESGKLSWAESSIFAKTAAYAAVRLALPQLTLVQKDPRAYERDASCGSSARTASANQTHRHAA